MRIAWEPDTEIRPLVVAADVVSLAELALAQNRPERLGVVADVKPVAHVHAVAVNRNRFPREHVLDDDGDELFGKLKRASLFEQFVMTVGKP